MTPSLSSEKGLAASAFNRLQGMIFKEESEDNYCLIMGAKIEIHLSYINLRSLLFLLLKKILNSVIMRIK